MSELIYVQNPAIFDHRIEIASGSWLRDITPENVIDVEVQAVFICDGDTVWVEENDANAFGVYLRYNGDGKNNPTEWIADLETRLAAEKFQNLIKALLKIS